MQSSLRIALTLPLAVLAAGCGTKARSNDLVAIGAGLHGPSGLHATVYAAGSRTFRRWHTTHTGVCGRAGSGATSHGTDGVFVVPRAGAQATRVVTGPEGPLGLLWIGRSLYVSSLGAVTRFSGFSRDRFRERRTIVDGPVPAGENNNLVRAPDGRLLMGVSSTCDHCVPRSPWAATIVSFRTDGRASPCSRAGSERPTGSPSTRAPTTCSRR